MTPQTLRCTLSSALAIGALLLLGACQNVADVDLKGKDMGCVSTCQADHAQCMSGPTMAPIDRNNLCVSALRSCARACPAEGKLDISKPQSADVYTQLKQLKELLDTGVITQAEFDARKKKVLEQ